MFGENQAKICYASLDAPFEDPIGAKNDPKTAMGRRPKPSPLPAGPWLPAADSTRRPSWRRRSARPKPLSRRRVSMKEKCSQNAITSLPTDRKQRLLGHENRTTTEIYLHSVANSERDAIRILELVREKSHTDSCWLGIIVVHGIKPYSSIPLSSRVINLHHPSEPIFVPVPSGWGQQKGWKVEPPQVTSETVRSFLLPVASVPRKSFSGQSDEVCPALD